MEYDRFFGLVQNRRQGSASRRVEPAVRCADSDAKVIAGDSQDINTKKRS